jgi:hypothetical protein
MVPAARRIAMEELLRLLANQLMFFVDPHGYSIVSSVGTANGSAFLDLKRGNLSWRLCRDRSQVTLELRLREDREYPSYSTDILKRWLSGERDDDAALLTDDVVTWIQDHLTDIETAVELRRHETIKEWDTLKRLRAKELR